MQARLVLAPVLAMGLVLSLSHAEAATKTLDGKKVKSLTWSASAGLQPNDADLVTGQVSGGARTDCAPPRCAKFPFVFAPAKGVTATGLAFQASWTIPVEDVDLYVAAIAKDGSYSEIAHCAAGAGTSEKLYLQRSELKPGKKYAVVVDFYRTLQDTVTAKVDFPGTNTIATTAPAAADGAEPVNCGL